jgi:hypothetical protein
MLRRSSRPPDISVSIAFKSAGGESTEFRAVEPELIYRMRLALSAQQASLKQQLRLNPLWASQRARCTRSSVTASVCWSIQFRIALLIGENVSRSPKDCKSRILIFGMGRDLWGEIVLTYEECVVVIKIVPTHIWAIPLLCNQ